MPSKIYRSFWECEHHRHWQWLFHAVAWRARKHAELSNPLYQNSSLKYSSTDSSIHLLFWKPSTNVSEHKQQHYPASIVGLCQHSLLRKRYFYDSLTTFFNCAIYECSISYVRQYRYCCIGSPNPICQPSRHHRDKILRLDGDRDGDKSSGITLKSYTRLHPERRV